MLTTRLLSAFLGIILVFIVMWAPHIYLTIAIAIIAVLALYELFEAYRVSGHKPISWVGYMSVGYLLALTWIGTSGGVTVVFMILVLMLLLLSLHIIISNNRITFVDLSITLFAIVYIPFLFSFTILARGIENGHLLVWLILIGGWVTDSFAYFIGKVFGKHKLIPDISPKKTIEGAVGGLIGNTVVMVLYGIIINKYFMINIEIIHFVLIGVLSSIAAQIGDLIASAIKRTINIKDFGSIMPGHGGIIDRFDSILFVSPIVYFYITLLL